jgi:hypothetical protein
MLDEHDDNMNKIDPSTWMKLISSSSIWVGIRPYIVED